jgi:glucose 1-dehydrogenase
MSTSPANPVLSGQIALVTGASSGIGRACAIGLAAAGAKVVVNYVGNPDGADQTVGEIARAGGEALAIRADVSREAEVEAMFAETVNRLGTLHILVANAGLQRDGSIVNLTLEQWQRVIDVNLTGQFLCARAAAREFLRRGPQPEISRATGKIICMSSVHQVIPWNRAPNYCASKGGVMLMMESMAQDLAGQRIRVNSIAPGAIRTPINRAAWETKAAMNDLLKLIPYGRIGEPEDIAHAAVWLASDESDYVTGTTLFVDGGMTLYPEFRYGG